MSSPSPIPGESPKKHGCLKASLITLGIGFVLAVSLFVLAMVLANREAKTLENASGPFFAKIQANEIQAAYAMAAPVYRESNRLRDLEAIVQKLDLAGFTSADWHYAAGKGLEESALEGSITTKSGATVPLRVTMVEDGDSFAVSGLAKKEKEAEPEKKGGSIIEVDTWAKKESNTKSGSWSWSTAKVENLRFTTPPLRDGEPPTFSADVASIVLDADLKNAPPNTDIKAVFVLLESADGGLKNHEVAHTTIEGKSGGVVTFTFERQDPIMAAGNWSIQLFIDGKLKAEKAFNVELDMEGLTRKAEAGDAEAQLTVGMALRHMVIGYTGPLNEAEAAKWLEKSAEQGDRSAQFYLGDSYMFGRGVTADPVTALSWLKKSAGQGLPEAQIALGTIYRDGELVERDLDIAASWFAKAADQGDVTATTRLGELFLNYGEGEKKEKGAELIRKAAAAGFPDAQFVLGQMNEMGVLVEVDLAKAREYFEAAAANGSPDAVEALKRLDAKPEE